MIRSFGVIAWNGFREARRNRVTLVLGAFAVALLAGGVFLTSASVAVIERVLVDVGLGSMSLVLVLLVVFLSSGLLSREIERRTVFLMMSKPISRGLFLLARQAGNMLTVTALLAGMAGIFLLQLSLYGLPVRESYLVSIAALWFELLLLSSVGTTLSSFVGQLVASTVTLGVYLIGHLSEDLYRLAQRADNNVVRWMGKATYYLLPNLERLNFRGHATYDVAVPGSELALAVAYAVGYSAVVISLGVLVFQRRDFK